MLIMRLTEHFTFEEFIRTSHQELQNKNNVEATTYLGNITKVASMLESLRLFFFRPVFITSGFRCADLNTKVGGSPTSQHLKGEAADFTVRDFQDATGLMFAFNWCQRHLDYGQLIFEHPQGRKPWIHISLPNDKYHKQTMTCINGEYKVL